METRASTTSTETPQRGYLCPRPGSPRASGPSSGCRLPIRRSSPLDGRHRSTARLPHYEVFVQYPRGAFLL